MGVSGQRHTPAALYPRERTCGTHLIRGWVGPRGGLDATTIKLKLKLFDYKFTRPKSNLGLIFYMTGNQVNNK
jgi:hypothetical protein